MLTKEGGIDIEEVAANRPEALARLHVDPLEGFQPYQARRLIYGAGIDDPNEQKQILGIIERLYDAFVGADSMLCEINPLIVTPDGEVKALDSKFTVDDNALYKHPDIAEMRDLEAYPPEERAAREKDVTYVKLDGEVGILGNGAGLVMSTLDVIALAGGRRGELLRPRRRRRCPGRDGCARDHQRRPAGALDPLQHLRRHHALRRGCARDPPGARQHEDRAPDRRSLRRHERRGRAPDPHGRRAGTNIHVASTMLDAAKRAVELGGMTDTWSKRAAGDAREPDAQGGPGPRPRRRALRTGAGSQGDRRRDRRRPRRTPASRGRRRGRLARSRAGHAARRHRARRGHPVCRRLVRRRRLPDRGAPLRRRRTLGARDGACRPRPRGRPGQPLPERAGRGGRAPARPEPRPLLQRGGVAGVLRGGRARGRRARHPAPTAAARALARARRDAAGRRRPSAGAARRPHRGRARSRARRSSSEDGRPSPNGDHRHERDAPRRPGPDRERGLVPRRPEPRLRDERRRRGHARARAARTSRASPSSTRWPRRSTRRARTRP